MADLSGESPLVVAPPQRRGPLFYIGAAGLLGAMAMEVVSVTGRQLSAPVHGALEFIQTAILVTASVSMLSATLGGVHATVHLVTSRASAGLRRALARFAAVLSAIFFLGLAVGSAWLIGEHWHAHEESELLRIPFRPLRVLSFLSIVALAVVFAYRVFAREEKRT